MYILVLTALLAQATANHCPQRLSPPPCLQGRLLALADMLAMTLQGHRKWGQAVNKWGQAVNL